MTSHVEVADTLVSAGYVQVAAALLADALTVADAEVAIDTARQDEAYQEDVIADAAGLAEDDAWADDLIDQAYQEERVLDAGKQVTFDEEAIAEAKHKIAAAAALVAVELIDTANVDGVIAVIGNGSVAETDQAS